MRKSEASVRSSTRDGRGVHWVVVQWDSRQRCSLVAAGQCWALQSHRKIHSTVVLVMRGQDAMGQCKWHPNSSVNGAMMATKDYSVTSSNVWSDDDELRKVIALGNRHSIAGRH